MRPPGSFKIARSARRPSVGGARRVGGVAGRRRGAGPDLDDVLALLPRGELRVQRIVDSLRAQIVEGGADQNLRIRQVFETPREIYRIELEVPDLCYQRTTLLDREALEDLLEAEEVRDALETRDGDGGVPGAGLEPARPMAR